MAQTSPSKIKVKEISEIAFVVKDLQKTMEDYWNILGIGPWDIWTFKPPLTSKMTYRGKPSQHSMKIGIAQVGSLMFELIQPLEGESIYKEVLEKQGEGVFQCCFGVENLPDTVRIMEKDGFACLTSADYDSGSYAYFDTVKPLKIIWEAVHFPPGTMPPPEARWPE